MVDDCGRGGRRAAGLAGCDSSANDLHSGCAASSYRHADAGGGADTHRSRSDGVVADADDETTVSTRGGAGDDDARECRRVGAGAALPDTAVWELCGSKHSAGDDWDVWRDCL